MGVAYLGQRADDAYHREVAIKAVRPGPEAEGLAARFAHERKTLAALTHPNIARRTTAARRSRAPPTS